jgi:hypothetical protein
VAGAAVRLSPATNSPDIFMGGIEEGGSRYADPWTLLRDDGTEWVSGCGHLTGTFTEDWLGIPASGKKTHMYFGQFYVMRNGKIANSYVMFDILSNSGHFSRGIPTQNARLRFYLVFGCSHLGIDRVDRNGFDRNQQISSAGAGLLDIKVNQ